MAIVFLTTLAVQVGAAFINNKKNSQHSALIAQKQQAFEEKVAREGMENAQVELAELCALQREINEKMQKDRLDLINSNHKRSLMLDAYAESLKDWPLMVPPYVLKNDTLLSLGWSDRGVIPLNCILTTSTDSKFNNAVFYRLEEDISCFCSRYWNVSSNKSIRFLQEIWRYTSINKDIGSYHKDLYAHLADIPTLIISPVIMDGKLQFRFYWWGLSPDPEDAHLNDGANMFDPELSISVGTGQVYTDDVVSRILAECTPKLEAFISYFADLYYWTFYKKVPTLPNLLSSKAIVLQHDTLSEYMFAYGERIVQYLEDLSSWRVDPELVVESTKSIMQNNPDSNLIYEIHKSILCNKDCLAVSDLPLLNGLLEFNSELTPELSQYKSKLEKEETITLLAFSNSDEMFYNVRRMYAYASGKNNRFNVKFIDDYSFIACVTDERNNVVYCNPKSRYCLFVTSTAIPLAKYKVGTLDLLNRRFYKGNPTTSPCDFLVYDSKSLKQQANKIRGFLQKTRDVFSQLSPILTMPANLKDVPSTITIYDIKKWILKNRINENEFRLALSYDQSSQLYCMVGSFVRGNEIIDDRSYISFFRYMDDSVKSILKYNHSCKLYIK